MGRNGALLRDGTLCGRREVISIRKWLMAGIFIQQVFRFFINYLYVVHNVISG